MKNSSIVSCLAILLLLLGCRAQQSRLTFQFKNLTDKEVKIYLPIDDKVFWSAEQTIQVVPDSIYTIPVKVKKGAYVEVSNGRNRINLFIQPGNTLSVTYDHTDKKSPCLITGNNAEGQALYHKIRNRHNIYQYARIKDFTKAPCDTVADKMWQNFQQLISDELKPFEKLYQEKKIDKPFWQYVKTDVTYFYALALVTVIKKHFYQSQDQQKPMYPGYGELWAKVYETYPLTKESLISPYIGGDGLFGYAESYAIQYRFYQDYKNEVPWDKTTGKEIIYDYYQQAFNDPEMLEYLLADCLVALNLNNKEFDRKISNLLVRYRQQFKNNPFSPFLEHYVTEMEDFHRKIAADFSDHIRFVDSFDKIGTYAELLERFKGKNVFVDFWFSTCGPCKEQFAYGKELKAFLKANGIEMLYISIDPESRDENWKNHIKYFDLEGHHIRTSKTLHKDIETYGVYSYPRYMLVNKEGEIVLPDALEPQKGEKLFRQIREALNK